MYSRQNYTEALEEIRERRVNARSEAEARNLELALKYPEIKKIDDELRGTGLALFQAACRGEDITPIRERNETLMRERQAFLHGLGLPSDYTEPQYVCKKCSDTGFVDIKMCSCLRSLLIKKNIYSSGMGRLIDRQSFDNFDLEWYRDDEENYKRMKSNIRTARTYTAAFPTKRGNLLLIGTTGTGKTHISTAIAREIIEQGYDVLYDSAQNIIADFTDDQYRRSGTESKADKYLECDLLIIDDLGAEFSNQMTLSILYNLLNTRQNKGLATIISTNLTAKELAARYEGRIYSRIVGSDYTPLFFTGKDHRIDG